MYSTFRVTRFASSLLAKVTTLIRDDVRFCRQPVSGFIQVRIHTTPQKYCHFEGHYTRYRPVVGTVVTRHLLSYPPPLTLYSVAAVGKAWPLIGSPLSKSINCTGNTFIASVTVDGFWNGQKTLGSACAVLRLSATCLFTADPISQALESDRNLSALHKEAISLCPRTRSQGVLEGCWLSCLQYDFLGFPLIMEQKRKFLTQHACYNAGPSNIGTTNSCCLLREARSEGRVKGRGIPTSRVHNLIIRT